MTDIAFPLYVITADQMIFPFRRKAVPAGIATGLDIGLGNVSLKLITLSFYSEFLFTTGMV